jgi:hypothetical protein
LESISILNIFFFRWTSCNVDAVWANNTSSSLNVLLGKIHQSIFHYCWLIFLAQNLPFDLIWIGVYEISGRKIVMKWRRWETFLYVIFLPLLLVKMKKVGFTFFLDCFLDFGGLCAVGLSGDYFWQSVVLSNFSNIF